MPAKTSLLLTVDHRQGALADCLDAFASAGLNLSKLESRPQPEIPWQYLFYLDVEANVTDPRMNEALERVHAPLKIDQAAFNEMAMLLRETLEDFNVDDSDIAVIDNEIKTRARFVISHG